MLQDMARHHHHKRKVKGEGFYLSSSLASYNILLIAIIFEA
jgi:hypothetical protein